MKIARYQDPALDFPHIGIVENESLTPLQKKSYPLSFSEVINAESPSEFAASLIDESANPIPIGEAMLLAPIDQQEVWAAGVTYKRSKSARMEESETSASCYDLVYEADRPEIFMKATPNRVVGPMGDLRIRYDSKWNVPEPELALTINSKGKLIGFTIGNDMSSRDIEGENPLYLPQAKVYNQCCGLGPWITLTDELNPSQELGIHLEIFRNSELVFQGQTTTSELARTYDDLIGWLTRELDFEHGCFLLTGTGVVPGNDFTLLAGDRVEISIDGIGKLINPIVQSTPS